MKKICFFSTVPAKRLQAENYSVLDIRILNELGYEVVVASRFSDIPFDCDLYYSWWASGSIIPLIKGLITRIPTVVIAGGNEVMFYRDSISGEPHGYIATKWYKKIATKVVLKYSNHILYVSKFMEGCVRKLGAARCSLVYNCVDTNLGESKSENCSYVMTVARLSAPSASLKRVHVFIRSIAIVLKKFPKQKFVIVGDKGSEFKGLWHLVIQLGIQGNVLFTGEVHQSGLAKWFKQCGLFVQISDTETFGMAILEAMNYSIPVLVSRRGAIPEVVGEDGFYVDHNNVDSVAIGIIKYLNLSKGEKNIIGSRLRDRACDYFPLEKRKESVRRVISGNIELSPKVL